MGQETHLSSDSDAALQVRGTGSSQSLSGSDGILTPSRSVAGGTRNGSLVAEDDCLFGFVSNVPGTT